MTFAVKATQARAAGRQQRRALRFPTLRMVYAKERRDLNGFVNRKAKSYRGDVWRYLTTWGYRTLNDLDGAGYAPPSHAELDYALVPDVDGIPGVYLDVSARGDHRLSADLDSEREGAAVAGYPVTALVQHRGGRGVDEAYVVLTLGDFAKLARAAEPIAASP